ncbi:MAG TPA: hypothetical protein VKA63_04750 [Candidatus Krumholzibacteria bacterium]|nr:hypothetical protein [Candidatus Krumholzibacteria bacterium]
MKNLASVIGKPAIVNRGDIAGLTVGIVDEIIAPAGGFADVSGIVNLSAGRKIRIAQIDPVKMTRSVNQSISYVVVKI